MNVLKDKMDYDYQHIIKHGRKCWLYKSISIKMRNSRDSLEDDLDSAINP